MSLNKVLTVHGRLNRLPNFLYLYLFPMVVGILLVVGTIFYDFLMYILMFFYLFVFYIQIIGSINRLHDLNKTGWLVLIGIIPVINIIFILYLLLAKGTKGENRFGPDPLEKSNNTIDKKSEL